MADIDIERKGPTVWPWIVGLLALVLIVWVWAASRDREEPQMTEAGEPAVLAPESPESPVGTAGTAPAPIREYAAFTSTSAGNAGSMGEAHEYTAEGIRKLAGALNSLVEQKPQGDARAKLEQFRSHADRIEKDPSSTQHAGTVRDVFTTAVDVIASVEGAPDTNELKSSAASIDPGEPLLEQREKVHSFFRQSAEAIRTASTG